MKTIVQKLTHLGIETGNPCVTISLQTHRTHPDSEQDKIVLKNLLKEATERVLAQYGKREVAALLGKLDAVESKIDINYNLDGLHIFLSEQTEEIIKTAWPVKENRVYIDNRFMVAPLIKAGNRTEDYFILVLSQGGVRLFEAVNEHVVEEVNNGDFPYPATPHFLPDADKASDPKQVDNMVREYLNKVDKAMVKVQHETGRGCVVISTEGNYHLLKQVADKPAIYLGHSSKDYNNVKPHQVAAQGWEIIQELQFERRTAAIEELQQAVSQGKVITDIQEIYLASLDGRGDLLVVNESYTQPVQFTGEREFDLVEDPRQPEAVDDIVSDIAWNVFSKQGRVVFTSQESLEKLGKIALKVRY